MFVVAALALLVAPVVRAAPLTATIQFKTPTKVFSNDDCLKLVDYLEPRTRGKATNVECFITTYPLGEINIYILLRLMGTLMCKGRPSGLGAAKGTHARGHVEQRGGAALSEGRGSVHATLSSIAPEVPAWCCVASVPPA